MDLLKDKTAVITGAHRGIGKAILEKFCEYGCNCFVINRKEDPVFTEYCENLQKEYSVKIELFYADFSSEDEVKTAVKQIISKKVPIDILVNNVGVAYPQNMFTMTKLATIKDTFEVNLFSSILVTQLISRSMMRNQKGSIVFISSSASFDGGANIEYSASKAAIVGAMRRMAIELGNFGIRVNSVAPGLTSTDMGNSMSAEDEADAVSRNIMKRKAEPSEIADAVAFLSSDMSRFITGQVLRVDGGLLK